MTRHALAPLQLASTDFGRRLEGFRHRAPAELQPTGIAELDALLGGGFPRGSVIELCGTSSSGRTSVGFSLLAQATSRQETCAVVDVSDSLDPMSLAAAGVDLTRVLWIRCGNTYAKNSLKKDVVASKAREPAAAQTKVWGKVNRGTTGWTHPRDQIRGIEAAIPLVMGKTERNKNFSWKVEVAETESLQRRDGVQKIMSPRSLQAEDVCKEPVNGVNRFAWKRGGKNKPWKILEQALKVTDLLLHAGGWGVVVFDLGNVSWVDVRRIELSTWFRFRRAIENTPTILLLVGEDACAKSCSSVVLRCERKAENWNSASMAGRDAEIPTFQGFAMEGQILSSRIGLPPAGSAQWVAKSLWSNNF